MNDRSDQRDAVNDLVSSIDQLQTSAYSRRVSYISSTKTSSRRPSTLLPVSSTPSTINNVPSRRSLNRVSRAFQRVQGLLIQETLDPVGDEIRDEHQVVKQLLSVSKEELYVEPLDIIVSPSGMLIDESFHMQFPAQRRSSGPAPGQLRRTRRMSLHTPLLANRRLRSISPCAGSSRNTADDMTMMSASSSSSSIAFYNHQSTVFDGYQGASPLAEEDELKTEDTSSEKSSFLVLPRAEGHTARRISLLPQRKRPRSATLSMISCNSDEPSMSDMQINSPTLGPTENETFTWDYTEKKRRREYRD